VCGSNQIAGFPEIDRNIGGKVAVWRSAVRIKNVSIKKQFRCLNWKLVRGRKDWYFS